MVCVMYVYMHACAPVYVECVCMLVCVCKISGYLEVKTQRKGSRNVLRSNTAARTLISKERGSCTSFRNKNAGTGKPVISEGKALFLVF